MARPEHIALCTSTTCVVNFDRQYDIRKLAYQMEQLIAPHFTEAAVLSVPDEADPQLPRIVFTSRHGFSQIIVTQLSIGLKVGYSADEWQVDPKRRTAYLKDKLDIVLNIMRLIPAVRINFTGITSQVRVYTPQSDEAIIQRMQKHYFEIVDPTMIDCVIRFSHKIGDELFSNVQVQNFREWPAFDPTRLHRLSYENAIARGIAYEHDLNDRLSFNERNEYYSENDLGFRLVEQLEQMNEGISGAIIDFLSN